MLKTTPEIHTIRKHIVTGESLTVEFKKCGGGLNRDVYETVCAFLNRHGGTLLMGVSDKGEITGIPESAIDKIRKTLLQSSTIPRKSIRLPICKLNRFLLIIRPF